MAGKLSYEFSFFVEDTCGYIPYAVIGIFILLAATFTSVYLLKIDSEVAETIYTTENNDPRESAINLPLSTLLAASIMQEWKPWNGRENIP
jgi:hypothetical protein